MGCSPDWTEVNTAQNCPLAVTVVIPTYNRSDTLISCLEHLEKQSFTDFEVILVDDGSTDATPQLIREFVLHTRLHLCSIRQENSGPARARNAAIARARAPICLLIGDDIFATPDFVKTHLELHRQRPEMEVAGLGLTRWTDEGQQVTKFMRWLEDDGVQFFYGELLRGVRPTWRHFYTSNLSVKTDLLRRFPSNEAFPTLALEDIELGYRIHKQHGLELAFLPQALAGHYHPTTVRDACRRVSRVGPSERYFCELWPEQLPPPSPWSHRLARAPFLSNPWLISPFTSFAEVLTRYWCPNVFMRLALSVHYWMGYKEPAAPVWGHKKPREGKGASTVTGP
jgi:hypothetical protein